MNYAAYGLGQGFAQGMNNNQLINAMNTASLIQYRRDQQRLQNRYADIAQQNADLNYEKWGMESQLKQQELEQKIFELQQKQNLASGQNFVRTFIGAIDSQDATAVNNLIQSDNVLKNLASQNGITSFNFLHQFSEDELRKLGVSEGMNPREYVIANRTDGTKTLFNAKVLASYMGVANLFTQEQLNQVFGGQQLSSLQQISSTPATLEGVEQVGQIVAKQRGAEEVYDPTLNAMRASSGQNVTATEQKQQSANKIQQYIDNFNSYTPEDYRTILTDLATDKGANKDQKLTLANNLLKTIAFDDNGNIRSSAELKQDSRYIQLMNILENNLPTQQAADLKKAREKTTSAIETFANMSQLMGGENADKGLGKFMEDTLVAKAETWVSNAVKGLSTDFIKIESKEVRQAFQNIFNTYLRNMSGQAVTGGESVRNEDAIGTLKDQNAIAAVIGLRDLINQNIEVLQSYNRNAVSAIENAPIIANLTKMKADMDNIIAKAKGQTIQASAKAPITQSVTRESVRKQVADMIPSAK